MNADVSAHDELKNLQHLCLRNDLNLSWILKRLKIDSGTFYCWKARTKTPNKGSREKIQKGISFFEKLEPLVHDTFVA